MLYTQLKKTKKNLLNLFKHFKLPPLKYGMINQSTQKSNQSICHENRSSKTCLCLGWAHKTVCCKYEGMQALGFSTSPPKLVNKMGKKEEELWVSNSNHDINSLFSDGNTIMDKKWNLKAVLTKLIPKWMTPSTDHSNTAILEYPNTATCIHWPLPSMRLETLFIKFACQHCFWFS